MNVACPPYETKNKKSPRHEKFYVENMLKVWIRVGVR